MQWYYAAGGEQVGPLDDREFHERVRSGTVNADTPVWREGLSNWVPYAQVSGANKTPAAPRKKLTLRHLDSGDAAGAETTSTGDAEPAPAHNPAIALLEPLFRRRNWIRFIGILNIIGGVFCVLSVAGIVVAWIPLWLGILLTRTSKLLNQACTGNHEFAMRSAMDSLGRYFKIMGVLALIWLIVGGLSTVAIVVPMIAKLLR